MCASGLCFGGFHLEGVLSTTSIARQTKTILVIDDEDDVRKLVAEVLRRCGHAVLEASNCSGALAICGRVRTIDLVVSDYNLSRENGLVLAEKLRKLLPSIVIIFMSGLRRSPRMIQ